jgi:hypothetical protein
MMKLANLGTADHIAADGHGVLDAAVQIKPSFNAR